MSAYTAVMAPGDIVEASVWPPPYIDESAAHGIGARFEFDGISFTAAPFCLTSIHRGSVYLQLNQRMTVPAQNVKPLNAAAHEWLSALDAAHAAYLLEMEQP